LLDKPDLENSFSNPESKKKTNFQHPMQPTQKKKIKKMGGGNHAFEGTELQAQKIWVGGKCTKPDAPKKIGQKKKENKKVTKKMKIRRTKRGGTQTK